MELFLQAIATDSTIVLRHKHKTVGTYIHSVHVSKERWLEVDKASRIRVISPTNDPDCPSYFIKVWSKVYQLNYGLC